MQTFVVKLSSQLTERVFEYSDPILAAMKTGNRVVVVSGGAIMRGLRLLNLKREATMLEMQAAAGLGQIELMKRWQYCCEETVRVAQFLYTHHDFDDPGNNIREVIEQAWTLGMLPVANGLDTVTNEETRTTATVSENSGVASRLGVILEADKLIMIGTEAYIYSSDPRKDPNAKAIREVTDLSDDFLAQFPAEDPQNGSFGGIRANIEACLYAARRGVEVVVTSGYNLNNLPQLLRGKDIEDRTVFHPKK